MNRQVISEIVDEMKNMADQLYPYTFPRTSQKLENYIRECKMREVTIDGYDIVLYFSRADSGNDSCVDMLQIISEDSPFLPFNLVSKLATMFLGKKHLSLIEFLMKDNRKIYYWSLTIDKNGKPLPPIYDKKNAEVCNHEGLSYMLLNPEVSKIL